jgi:uncharacterized membrane protein YqiK
MRSIALARFMAPIKLGVVVYLIIFVGLMITVVFMEASTVKTLIKSGVFFNSGPESDGALIRYGVLIRSRASFQPGALAIFRIG